MAVSRKISKEFVFHREEPRLPKELAPLSASDRALSLTKISLTDHCIHGLTVRGSADTTFHLENSTLERVNFADSRFATIRLIDVRLVNCDLANLETHALTLVRVEFIDCRMTGLRAGKADCQHVLLSGGDQRYTQFRFSHLRAAEFNDCNFEEADLYGTDLTGARFRNCNLQRTEMSKTRLLNADLRGSRIEGLQLAADDIKGAIVDITQAMLLAPLLGIQIR